MPQPLPLAAAPVAAPVAVPAPAARSPGPSAEVETAAVDLAVIKSPIVGTFYRAPEPGAANFVEIGDVVKKGQVLCIIEAMKLMNDIESEADGEITAIYVENGRPVQFGDRLFALKVSGLGPRARRGASTLCFQQDSHRQPRRDRSAHHLRVPRARHQDRRRLFGGRRALAARPVRRRRRVHRPGAEPRQLLERPGDHQRGRDHRRRRHPSRATGSSPRAPIWPKSARPATSSSSGRIRTSSG